MSGELLPDALVRAWQRVSGARGGQVPSYASELLPVVIHDDVSRGGYPGCAVWFGGVSIPPAAANFAAAWVTNVDPVGSRSVVVVDRLWIASAGIVHVNAGFLGAPYTTPAIAGRSANVLAQSGAAQNLPSVSVGSHNALTSVGGFPFADVAQDVSYSLCPQATLVLTTFAVASGIDAFFAGRYYAEA